jgi:arylsulfatase A-like enzyme
MDRPLNVIWMVTDHQAHGNRPPVVQDFSLQRRLAREGTCFTRAYTVLPICSPARASMLTGLYPHAHGITENDGRFGGRAGLEPGDWLVHRPLSEAGYRCAWFGKWHLDKSRSAMDYGFEGFSRPGYGYPYATPTYRDYLDRMGLSPPFAEIEIPGESGLAAGTRIPLADADDWFDFESGAARLDGPAEAHEAFFLAHLAEDWLKSLGGEPFFLRIDPWGPHPPYVLARPYHGMLEQGVLELSPGFRFDLDGRPPHHRTYRDYWRATLGLDAEGWRRMVVRALEHVALVEAALIGVLDAVDRLGLAESTLVIFTADHGDAVGSNGGVCNKGGLMVEETMRIPLLVRGPGIASGKTCDRLVANFDIPPSILQICGLEHDVEFHGMSLYEATGKLRDEERKGLMAEHYGLHEPLLQRAYYADRWKLVVQESGFAELYDLKADPYEMRNLAARPQFRGALEGMWAGLRDAMSGTADRGGRLSKILAGPAK